MSIQAVAWAIRQKVGSPTGKVLLLCLANYADENGECWPSQTTISNEAELGERATHDWLKALEDAGFIERRRRNRADGSRTSDLFRLCLEKRTENPPSGLPAKSAGRPNQPAGSSAPTGISRRAYRQEMPGNEPVWAGIAQRQSSGWAWMVAAGILTLLVGLLIMLRWPVNSLWVIGIFLAVDLMFQGLAYFTYGLGLRRHPHVG